MKKDGEGNYYFVDRIGDTFRWKGENVSTQEVAEIISQFPGVAFAGVYGVQVPGSEGRVGMAAITLEEGTRFDPKAFCELTNEKLSTYARPAFVRITAEVEVTGTFKMSKTELKKAGYDPALVSDPLFFRATDGERYLPLDPPLFGRIQSGELRL